MSYGSAAGVGALSALYSSSGTFTVSTTPTLAAVNNWLDEVSALLDTALEDEGFATPVTTAAIVKELDLLVNGITVDLVNYSHNAGRFYTEQALKAGVSPFMTIDKEVHEWVKRKSVGFEAQGLTKENIGRNVASFDLL